MEDKQKELEKKLGELKLDVARIRNRRYLTTEGVKLVISLLADSGLGWQECKDKSEYKCNSTYEVKVYDFVEEFIPIQKPDKKEVEDE